jgi:DNA-binding CsgD family transcriptional regulator
MRRCRTNNRERGMKEGKASTVLQLEDFAEVSRSRSPEALLEVSERIIDRLGFERFALTLVTPKREIGKYSFSNLDNVPDAYKPIYACADRGQNDPVMQFAKRSNVPMVWGRKTYDAAGQLDKWEEQRPFGYASGIIYAAHLPNDIHVIIGVETGRDLQLDSEGLLKTLSAFQLFAAYCVDPCISVLGSQAAETENPLTARERECLLWTIEGKTAWEIGEILAISQRTVVHHTATAAVKLDAIGKYQAALKALRLGWLR